ncbi:MAG: signal recognition particle protein [Puniceicoccales bacterium]|jgi:signal recognition particle subunit SRP54|nr:signal recognition particle protein [Puniceicoccales bacterium]
MFASITDKISNVLKNLRGLGKISEKNVADALEEIRISLLSADVNREAADEFIGKIHRSAIGQKVLDKILPEQQIVKIVHDELVELLGGNQEVEKYTVKPLKILLAGLHGSGKTTTAGKLALLLKDEGYNPLLVACDIYRPAAIDQLKMVADNISVAYYAEPDSKNACKIAKHGLQHAEDNNFDAIIFDTAGRLHVDKQLIEEIKDIKKIVSPNEVFLVADGALGQESVNIAKMFNDAISLSGIILTKLDGDARGGAALSMKYVTGVPIKFVGTGEKSADFSAFHPKRMANRILGMGDVVSLVEKAQQHVDKQEQEKLSKKIKKAEFDLNDFLASIQQIKKMGPMSMLMGMLPGMPKMPTPDADGEKMKMTEAIIQSMTIQERAKPSIINSWRRTRIAKGAGVELRDVNALLKQFAHMQKMMKSFKGEKGIKKMQAFASQFNMQVGP